MENYLSSLTIRKMQIKYTLRYRLLVYPNGLTTFSVETLEQQVL